MSAGPLVIVGDVLLDREIHGTVDRLCPEAPVPVLAERSSVDRPGGAGLAALLAAAADGDIPEPWGEVVLVAAVGVDEPGERLRELLAVAGVGVVALPLLGPTPEKIRMRTGEHLLLRVDRGGESGRIGEAGGEVVDVLRAAGALLVSDYGRGVTARPELRRALAGRRPGVPLVWDPHPHGGDPVAGADLVTPNRTEAMGFLDAHLHLTDGAVRPTNPAVRAAERSVAAAMAAAVRLRHHWAGGAVAITLGERGAVLSDGAHAPRLVPTPLAAHGDPCGAGDRFAGAAVAALAAGADALGAVTVAVAAAAAYVAAGGALALLPEESIDKPAGRLLDPRPAAGTRGRRSRTGRTPAGTPRTSGARTAGGSGG